MSRRVTGHITGVFSCQAVSGYTIILQCHFWGFDTCLDANPRLFSLNPFTEPAMTAVEAAAGVPKGPGQKAGMSKGKYKALMLYKGKCKSKAVVDNGKGKGTHQGDQNLPTPPATLALTIPDTPSPPKSDEPKEAAPPTGGTQTMPMSTGDASMTPPPGTTATGEIKMTPPPTGAIAAICDGKMTPPPSNTSTTGAGATTTPPPAHQRATPTSSPGDTQSPSTAPATDPKGMKGNLKGKLKAAKGKLQGGKMGGIGNGIKGKGVGNNGAAGQTSAVAEAGFCHNYLTCFYVGKFWETSVLKETIVTLCFLFLRNDKCQGTSGQAQSVPRLVVFLGLYQ